MPSDLLERTLVLGPSFPCCSLFFLFKLLQGELSCCFEAE
jgi:hypothetical protein